MATGKFHPGPPPWGFNGQTGTKDVAKAGNFPVGSNLGPAVQLIDVRTEDGHPRVMTLGLGILSIDSDPAAGIVPKCKAIVEWGAGGAPQRTEIDFINGTVLRIACDHIRVNVQHEDPVNVSDARVSAFVTYDHVSPGVQAQRTLHIPLIAVAAEFPVAPASVILPPFAVSVRFLASPKTNTYTLKFLRVGGPGGIDLYQVTVPAGGLPPSVPISNWAKFMRILNEGPQIDQGELIFSFPF